MNKEGNVIALASRREFTEEDPGTDMLLNHEDAVLQWIRATGVVGCIWREFAEGLSMHHGQASGMLSNLHRRGKIARLTTRRDRCKVYVHPDFVNGRPTDDDRPIRLVDELYDCLRDIPDEVLALMPDEWLDEREALIDRYIDRRC